MYRDDPLDDEDELRTVVGDEAVDLILSAPAADGPTRPVEAAVDALRVLQGWVTDEAARGWFHTRQQRLDGRTPVEALAAGATDDVLDSASRWAAAQG